MSRILKVLLLASLVMVWCSAVWGAASSPKYQMRGPRIDVDARDFMVAPPTTRRTFVSPRSVGATAVATTPGAQLGDTYYDYQHNGSVGRQVDEFNGKIQASWMKAPGPSASIRTVNWNSIDVVGSPAPVVLDNGLTASILPLGDPRLAGGQEFDAVRPGYTNYRNRAGGKAVTQYHDAPETGGVQYWETRLDQSAGSGVFAGTPSVSPNPDGDEYQGDAVIWPKQAISSCGGEGVHHGVGTWSGAANETWYWRGIINEGTTTISWDSALYPIFVDPSSVGISNVIEAFGDEVTIVLGKQVNSTNADVGYYRSTDCGLTWILDPADTLGEALLFHNVTEYLPTDDEGYWNELNAVYDPAGELHIIWNTAPANGQNVPCNLYHWSPTAGSPRLITSAGWTNTCGGGEITNIGSNNGAGTNNLAIAEVGISVKPAGLNDIPEELLYAVWTQFGPTDTDCATVDDQGTLGGHVNGEIYYSVSSNDGLTWDRPQNLTGTETPDCDTGTCASESWTTVAAEADSGVYISYVEDTHAGPIVFGGGSWSNGAYRVLAAEARAPILEPVIAVTPTQFIELNADPAGGSDTVNLRVISVGNADLEYTATVTDQDGGIAHVQIDGAGVKTGSIAAGTAPDVLPIEFDALGLADGRYVFLIEVVSNDKTNNPDSGGTPIEVELEVFAQAEWNENTEDTLSTGSHRMQVSAALEMGDQGTDGTGFYNYADSSEWMFSGSPVITRTGDPDPITQQTVYAYHNAFMGGADRTRGYDGRENKSFRAQSPMTIVRDSERTDGDSTYLADWATGMASTTDSVIGIDYEMIFPRDPDKSYGCVFKFKMYNRTSTALSGINYGVAADLDSDPSAGENAGAGSESNGWIAAVGGESDDSANFFPNNNLIAVFHLPLAAGCPEDGAVAAQVLANPNYVHPENSFNVDSLELLFSGFGALETWGSNIHIDTQQQFDDVGVMMVSGYNASLGASGVDTIEWGYGVAVSSLGTEDLETTIAALRAATVADCQVACRIEVSGDVAETAPGSGVTDGRITSADIIYLVNFAFKGGPAPLPCSENGDVTCDGNVTSADIIWLVNYTFKGGAPPCDICAFSPC